MNEISTVCPNAERLDSGPVSMCALARYHRIAGAPQDLRRQMAPLGPNPPILIFNKTKSAAVAERDGAKAPGTSGFSGARRTPNLGFPITSAGMAESVEVQTGKRCIPEHVFSQLVEVGSEALHER